jgi:hypothetical protein
VLTNKVPRKVPTVKENIIFKANSSLKFLETNIFITKPDNVIKKFDKKLFIVINLILLSILNNIFFNILLKTKYEKKIK